MNKLCVALCIALHSYFGMACETIQGEYKHKGIMLLPIQNNEGPYISFYFRFEEVKPIIRPNFFKAHSFKITQDNEDKSVFYIDFQAQKFMNDTPYVPRIWQPSKIKFECTNNEWIYKRDSISADIGMWIEAVRTTKFKKDDEGNLIAEQHSTITDGLIFKSTKEYFSTVKFEKLPLNKPTND